MLGLPVMRGRKKAGRPRTIEGRVSRQIVLCGKSANKAENLHNFSAWVRDRLLMDVDEAPKLWGQLLYKIGVAYGLDSEEYERFMKVRTWIDFERCQNPDDFEIIEDDPSDLEEQPQANEPKKVNECPHPKDRIAPIAGGHFCRDCYADL